MIPILFNKDEKTFTSLGLGQMDATLVEVERERNGNYTLYAEVPFNSPQAKHLTKEMLIKADAGARTKWQTFKINRTIKDTNADVIKVYADHISMDTINDAMKPKVVITQLTAEGALRQWANNLVSGKSYDVQSDITHEGSTEWTIDEVENARQALGGVSGSILDVWGGEYEFDNNTIILHKEMGRTAPTVLEYGRNIVGLEYEELIDGVYTSIYPYATYTPKSEDNKQLPDIMVTLDELIVDSEYAGNYETKRIQIVDFSNEFDSNAENPEIPTQAKLRTLAKAYVKNNGYGIPKISQEIDFVDLSKTLDYQDIQVMEEIELNDRVPVYYPNIDAETNDVKVTTTNWDVLNNRYSKITLSTIGAMNTTSITSKLNTAIKDLKAEQKKINNTVPYLINGQGNRVWWTTPNDNMEHKIDDTWFKKNGKYTIIYRWNGSMWEEVLNDETFITEIEAEVNTAIEEAEKAVQSAKDADTKAQSALTKAGANANVLTTHQSTLDTIKNTTIPNVNKVATDAMAEAKSAMDEAKLTDSKIATAKEDISGTISNVSTTAQQALSKANTIDSKIATVNNTITSVDTRLTDSISTSLSKAQQALDEANKADGKISDYVTKNGLVSGTTVDSKINTATGEINKKITTVESDIKNLDNTNLFSYLNRNVVNEGTNGTLTFRDDTPYGFYMIGSNGDTDDIRMYDVLDGNGFYTVSFDMRGTQNGSAYLNISANKKAVESVVNGLRTTADNNYHHFSKTIEVTDFVGDGTDYISFNPNWAYVYLKNIKIQKGKYDTGFTPALADQYTQHDFQIFESAYNEDVKGISSTLTELSNKKVDGTTYQNFYENEYKRTAKDATDAFTAVNKIVSEDGTVKDVFSKAVYEQNASRQSSDFNEVTKDLVKTATYESGIDGVKEIITSVEGKVDNIKVGGRNFILNSGEPLTPRGTGNGGITASTTEEGYYQIVANQINGNYFYFTQLWDLRTNGQIINNFKQGDDLTFSIDIKSPDSTNIPTLYVYGSGNVYRELVGVMGTEFSRFYLTVNLKDSPIPVNIVMGISGKSGTFVFRHPKIEKGNIATDWTPAPEDTLLESDFKSFQADYEQNAQGITSRLSTAENNITTNNTAFTTFKENDYKRTAERVSDTFTKQETTTMLGGKADASQLSNYLAKSTYERDAEQSKERFETIESDLDNISVGGRNLLQNTSDEWKTLSMDVGSWFTNFGYDENYKVEVGQTYTFSIIVDKVNPDDTVPINLHLGLSSVRGSYTYDIVTWRQNNIPMGKKVSITYTITENDVDNGARPWFAYRLRNEQKETHVKYKEAKLEKGSIATDWTPAVEDMANISYVNSEVTRSANAITTSLSNYARTTDLNGLATETYADNKAVSEASKVSSELTKYELKTGVDSKVSSLATTLRTETADKMRTVYTKSETETLLGKKADNSALNNYVQQATYESGIDGVSQSLTRVEGKVDGLQIGGRNLIPQSDFNNGIPTGGHSTKDGFQFNGVTYSNENSEFKVVFPTSGVDTSVRFVFWSSSNKLNAQKGDKITLSFKGRTDSANNLCVRTGGTFTSPVTKIAMTSSDDIYTVTFEAPIKTSNGAFVFWLENAGVVVFDWMKLELGSIATDWTPAPEDTLTQDEYKAFKSDYESTVQGITGQITSLSTSKLDGNTYTNFLSNDYKTTAERATSAFTKVNKVIDANGNSIDAFAKAVYEQNATRQSASFNEVTKDLVTTATYTSGIKGINSSITSIQGDIRSLTVGGQNMIKGSDKVYARTNAPNISIDGIDIDGLVGGEEYTFSFDIRSTTATYLDSLFINSSINKLIPNSPISNEWTRLSATFKWVEGSNYNGSDLRPHFYPKDDYSGTHEVKNVKLEKGGLATEWSPSPEDMLGQADFQIFKGTYETNDQAIKNRLTAIDSNKEGSVIFNTNLALETAKGNSQLITTINKNYVTQQNIDTSILSDKRIKDTRSENQLPSWYFTNYPSQEVREFKQVSTMGVGSGTYGILTTNVPWSGSSGGTVKQTFETNTETHVRQSNVGATAWGAWSKQIDTSDTTYQKITQTSSLYERVLGSTENNLNTNISRIVQTSNVIQQTVTSAMNVENRNLLITKNATKDSWLSGSESYPKTTLQANSGASTSPDLIEVKSGDKFTLSKNETTLHFRVSFLNSNKVYIGRYVQNAKVGTVTPPSGTAYMWVSYPTNADAKVEKGEIATGYSPAPEDTATQSQITQLADNINLKVSNNDLLSQINVQAGSVLIQSGTNKLNITPTTTYIQNSTIESAMIKSIDAGKITAGTLDASKVTVTNIDANNITANKTSFIQSNWNAINNTVSINASGIRSSNSSGDWTLYHSGAISFGNSSSQGIYLEYADSSRNGLAINNRGALNTDITLDLMSSARNTINFGRRTDTNGYDFRIDHYQGTKVSFDGRGVQRYTFNVNSDSQSHAISILGHGATSGYNSGSGLSIGMETADGITKGSRFYFSSNSDLVWLAKNNFSDLKPLAVFDLQFRWGQNGRKSMKTVLEYLSRASGVDINNIPDA